MQNLNKKIKVIMFDLDGTLLNHECKMSKATAEMLLNLKDSAYKLCLNSGRPHYMAKKVLDEYGVYDCFDYIFGCNGAEYYDADNQKSIYYRALTPEMIHRLAKHFKDAPIVLCLIGEGVLKTDRKCDLKIAQSYAKTRDVILEEYDFNSCEETWPKILAMLDDEAVEDIQKMVLKFSDPDVDAYFSNKNLLELVPKGVNKYEACLKLMEMTNIKNDEILSFGDADNDVPMLSNTVGVLMGNAKKELHDLFVNKTLSVDEDGVYHYLNKEGFFQE